eukprot:TRINITY_DN583_c0_g1_i1.p1 TRINITY_DN583_c0_g1~~TRINITY_DN583_c0_g1_i1.p1  ORF type:complete len:314 (+),score=22.82 TRINITY_DN583_c0_g1_i1:11-952(+)
MAAATLSRTLWTLCPSRIPCVHDASSERVPRLLHSGSSFSKLRVSFVSRCTALPSCIQRNRRFQTKASLGDPAPSEPDYDGVYGSWKIEQSDRLEVFFYRAGLVTCSSAFIIAASTAYLPDGSFLKLSLLPWLDTLYALGASGLGLSLILIHIYVTPIKRALQLLWLIGAFGSGALAVNFATPADKSLVEFVVDNPAAVWAVGPLFAALTGLVFKEGLCYGKLEAAALVFVIPSLLLGHLSGITSLDVEKVLLGVWMLLIGVFAARKFTQPVKDDIGDKSVFIFQALPPERQQEVIRRLQQARGLNTVESEDF